MRLQKYMASCGIASRRKCEQFIIEGKIKINDVVVTELGTCVKENDVVSFLGEIIKPYSFVYIMLNKPVGYITSVSNDPSVYSVMNLTSDIKERIYPVGRLDVASEGLLIMTNDGEFSQNIIHPSNHVNKTYILEVSGQVTKEIINKLEKGVLIDNYKTKPTKIDIIGMTQYGVKMQIRISEGRNRQIRKMFGKFKCTVKKLKRISIGEIHLGNLPIGKWRYLNPLEIKKLKVLKLTTK